MSATHDSITRHRKLTEDIRTRVPKDMREGLQAIADRKGWSLSDAAREAVAEFIQNNPLRGRK